MMRHHLHMPSYFLGTFTEYPEMDTESFLSNFQCPFHYSYKIN